MSDWKPIESAPHDGSKIWVKRVYERRIVKEGYALFGVCAPEAPQRQPLGADPLGRLPYDAARDEVETREASDTPRWLTVDRMYSFPQPTHWLPGK